MKATIKTTNKPNFTLMCQVGEHFYTNVFYLLNDNTLASYKNYNKCVTLFMCFMKFQNQNVTQ